MLKELKIQNFRGIKSNTISDFNKINVFIGKANSGKTSVLEAVYMALTHNPKSVAYLSNIRTIITDDDVFESLFHNYDLSNDMILEGKIDDNRVKISVTDNPSKKNITIPMEQNADFISTIGYNVEVNGESEIFAQMSVELQSKKISLIQSKFTDNKYLNYIGDAEFIATYSGQNILKDNLKNILENNEKRDEINEYCRQFDENIMDIRFIGEKVTVELKGLSHTVNIKAMGKGFNSYINIMAAMAAGKKYIIIDEIENGIHFETIDILLKNILSLSCEYGLQFFIATHSNEILKRFYHILENEYAGKDIVSVYNSYIEDNNHKYIKYSQADFLHVIKNDNEIRD